MISPLRHTFHISAVVTCAAILLLAASVSSVDADTVESTSANMQATVEYPALVSPEDLGQVRITFRNLNAFEVLMIQPEGLFLQWKIEVSDESSGSIVAPTDAGRALLESRFSGLVSQVWLKTGESTSWQWRIDSLYALPPGRYRISMNRQFLTRGGEQIDVTLPAFEMRVSG